MSVDDYDNFASSSPKLVSIRNGVEACVSSAIGPPVGKLKRPSGGGKGGGEGGGGESGKSGPSLRELVMNHRLLMEHSISGGAAEELCLRSFGEYKEVSAPTCVIYC